MSVFVSGGFALTLPFVLALFFSGCKLLPLLKVIQLSPSNIYSFVKLKYVFINLFFIDVWLIYNVSGVQQSDSVIQILFYYMLLQDSEYSSLCFIVGLCCLSISYIGVCIC